jgi:predicted nucleotidyltransferase
MTHERIERAADALIALGAREVFVFGSAATGRMNERSDVDLAVSGLPPERYFRAMTDAGRILESPLDLIDLDEPNPFVQHLRDHGALRRVR